MCRRVEKGKLWLQWAKGEKSAYAYDAQFDRRLPAWLLLPGHVAVVEVTLTAPYSVRSDVTGMQSRGFLLSTSAEYIPIMVSE